MTENCLNISFQTLSKESIIEFIAAAVALGIISILWQNRKASEVKFLILVELFAAIWAIMYGMEFLSTNLETKKLWSQFSYFGIAFLPLSFFLFATSFSHKKKIINPFIVTILSVIPFLTLILVFTNDLHRLIWKEVRLVADLNMITYKYGIGFWIFWGYSILLILGGLFNLVYSVFVFTAYYKSMVKILLIATIIPLCGNLVYVTGLNPIPGFDWTPVLFIFTGLVITFGIIHYRMFELVPFARNKLIDIMCDGVVTINKEGFIEDCNPAFERIFNLNHEECIHKHYSLVFKNIEQMLNALSDSKPKLINFVLEKQDKQKFYQVRLTPLKNQMGEYSGQLVQINDITSLKEAETKLKLEIKERGSLIDDLDAFNRMISHDLRNLLGSISSSSEIIEKSIREGDTELPNNLAPMIKNAAQKAIYIIQELFILTRYSHNNIEKTELNMHAIFADAKKQLHVLIEKNKAHISAPDSWPSVFGHAACVELILTNFLSNAINYGGSPPVITAGATLTGHNTVKFWMRDNGNGIPPEDHHRIFQKYVRLDPERSEGYGLGLPIVKRIVGKLGGQVGVESTGQKGKGAMFWFELPLF
jgi:PAS domain S-box-containing protein